MVYQGAYFDGSSTLPKSVEIKLFSNRMQINFTETEFGPRDWDYHKIVKYEHSKKKSIIKYGGGLPFELLEVNSPDFHKELKSLYPQGKFLKSSYFSSRSYGLKAVIFLLSFFVILLSLIYFLLIPLTMEGVASIFPQHYEAQLGKGMKENFIKEAKVDSTRTKLINNFFSQLEVKTDYKINITVVKSDVQNAFALPGGEIVVYSALLDSISQYSELVALLGHETGHIQNKHTLKMLLKNVSNYLIISAIFQDYSGIMSVLIENASEVEQLSYNRKVEAESDEFGFAVLVNNKVDPKGMVMLFESLKRGNKAKGEIPEFLMTHPKLESRIDTIKEKISNANFDVAEDDSLLFYFRKLKVKSFKF